MASDSRNKAQQKPVTSPPEVIPVADAAYRRPLPQAEKANSRRLKLLLRGTGVVFLAMLVGSAIYGSPLNWTFPTTRSQAVAGLSSAADVLKLDLEAITDQSGREEERSATRDLSAALTQLTVRLDQIEHEFGARLDKLSERVDQDSSSRFADIAARLDKLEKKAALPATPASESADVVSRLDKLEKESSSRLRRPQNLLISRQGSTSWRKEQPSRAQVRPMPSRLPGRNNRRLWQGRNLPPRMKRWDPTIPPASSNARRSTTRQRPLRAGGLIPPGKRKTRPESAPAAVATTIASGAIRGRNNAEPSGLPIAPSARCTSGGAGGRSQGEPARTSAGGRVRWLRRPRRRPH